MVAPINNDNIFARRPVNSINPVQTSPGSAVVEGETSPLGKKKSTLFAGAMEGINPNIGVGDYIYIAKQAGKEPGVGRTLGFA